jgi:uncharacterized protein YggE
VYFISEESVKMSNRIKLLAVVALLATSLAACTGVQAAPRSESPTAPRAITVVGEGKVSLEPDLATINVGAETRANTVSEAKAEVDAQMAAIATALQKAGVDEKDIQTSHYSIYYEQEPMPVISEGPAPENRGAYRVSNMVRVTVRDVDKAGDVLDAVVQAGANQVSGVNFTVSDESTWQSEARAKAMADARSRAQELADLADVDLGQVLSVSEVIGSSSVPMVAVERGLGGGGIAPGELELSTQIQVTFAIQ